MIDHADSRSLISHSSKYCIRVAGRMDPSWRECLQGMTVTIIEAQDQSTVTELCGQLPDQSALMGMLEQLHDCAISVISVECLADDPPTRKRSNRESR